MAGFQQATKKKSFLRMALDGPTGAGKTYTALRFAFAFKGANTRVGVINSESGAVEKYVGLSPDGIVWDFKVLTLDNYAPTAYVTALEIAARENFDVVIVDSLSHAWSGSGGALELVDKAGKNSFTDGWRKVSPMHNEMIEAIVRAPLHVIATMRTKMEYLPETRPDGKVVPRKVGLKPVQREGMEYEFDVVCDIDQETHTLTISKTRCHLLDGKSAVKPGIDFMAPLVAWLDEGVAVPAPTPVTQTSAPQGVSTPASAASQPAAQPPAGASKDQIAEIKRLGLALYDGNADAIKDFFSRNNIKSAELTNEKADKLIASFRAKIDAKASAKAGPALTDEKSVEAFLRAIEQFEAEKVVENGAVAAYRNVHGYDRVSEIPAASMERIVANIPVAFDLKQVAAEKGFNLSMFCGSLGVSHLWDAPTEALIEKAEHLREPQAALATAGN